MIGLGRLGRLGALGALRGSGVAWSPLALFAAGEKGAWYDPSDLSTLFQDAAGTTPVTAADDPVRLMLDKSGNDNHAVAPSDAARPLLKQTAGGLWYLQFDGVDDNMFATFASVIAQPSSLAMAFDPGPSVSYRAWLGTIASTGTNRTTVFNGGTGAEERWFAGSNLDLFEISADTKTVLVGEFDGVDSWCKQDGAVAQTGNAGTNNADGIAIGSLYSNGTYYTAIKFYGLLRLSRAFSESEISAVEEWAAKLSGVTLP